MLAEIRTGKYKHFSIALYPELNLRHIGILGAVPPAIKGLNQNGIVVFHNENEYTEYQFQAAKKNDDTNELITDDNTIKGATYNEKLHEYSEQLQALIDTNKQLTEKINELEITNRRHTFNEYAGTITFHNTLLTPSQRSTIIDIMELAHNADSKTKTEANEFNEHSSSLTNKIKTFINTLSSNTAVSDYETANTKQNSDLLKELELHQFNSNTSFNEYNDHYTNTDDPRHQLHHKAKDFCKHNPEVNYADAIDFLINQ